MQRLAILFFLSVISLRSAAQEGIGYFYDYTHHLNVFQKGNTDDIESYRVSDIRMGQDYLAYIDSRNDLILYYDHNKQVLEEFPPTKMVATQYAFVYQSRNRLMICENGEKKLLSKYAVDFFVGDSIVIWQSGMNSDIMCYYKGEISVMEASVSSNVIHDCKAGVNIAAFNTLNYDFKIYYNNNTFETGTSRITDYQCGRNIVAFTDIYKNTFNVFYKGEIQAISSKPPKEFMVSNETVTFIDADDNFYIFYQGLLTKVDSYAPEFYFTQNNVTYFSYSSVLKIVYEGKIFKDQLIDQNHIIPGINSILYSTSSNTPKFFCQGKIISDFYVPKPYVMQLNGDLPSFTYGSNIAFYYEGKMYEYGTGTN